MFSHDGLKDVLTHLAAPPLFYEELRREVSRMERNGKRFGILRLVLAQQNHSNADVVNFSECIVRATRGEELVARLGDHEFAVLVRGDQYAIASLLERILARTRDQNHVPVFLSSYIDSHVGEGALDLLNRLDTFALSPSASEALLT